MALSQDIEQQIKVFVVNGLTQPEIEAVIGRKLDKEESEFCKKCRTIHRLREKKRISEKHLHKQSGYDAVMKHRDKYSSIDDQMEKALKEIDWERRNRAEKSLCAWVDTYMCSGVALNDPPSQKGYEVLAQMESALTAHKNYMICMGRGFGKSSYCICAALYALATGIQKYVMIISNNAASSSNLLSDVWRVIEAPDTDFAHDYPEVCLPFHEIHGSFRRRQMYRGRSTQLQKNAGTIILATLTKEDGTPYPTSGSIITCRGIGSGIRGAKKGTLRPSLVLLDDLQDFESAQNPSQVEKLMEIINKDILPLAGKERLSVLQTATPICPDDLVEKIRNDKSWKTSIYPAIISYPQNMKLWETYFSIYDRENVEEDVSHKESLKFYEDNRKEMDDGAEVFSPNRYSRKDGHLSAIQKLLEMEHSIGEAAFQSEFQMNPKALQFALPINSTIVQSRKSSIQELTIPQENVQWVCASSDLNLAKCITTVIVVFFNNHTATIIYHKFRKCRIPANIPEQEYYTKVYDLLARHGQELRSLGIRIDAWAIDANGVPNKAVEDFSKNSIRICGIPAAGFIGRASHTYRSFLKSRLKEDVNRTLLCGDDDEHKKAGSGRRWTFFDSDFYHERVQKGFLQQLGNVGSLSWYDGNDHAQWSIQVCNEKLVMKKLRQDGTFEYHWRDNGDHDALDAIGQALACYGSMGFAEASTGRTNLFAQRMRFKKRIKVI